MRIQHHKYAALLSIAVSTLAFADPISPLEFREALDYSPVQKRQVDCPDNFFSCEDRGDVFAGTCCENGQLCSLDAHSQAACCPTSATCTGVAPTGPTPTASYVSNTYFSFPYIPTSFPNAASCTSALSQCSRNYGACVSGLSGGSGEGYGVTIVVPGGGGTTVGPTQATIPAATATSICSSLSSEACYDLHSTQCDQIGTASGLVIGDGNGAAKPTAAACMAGVIAGVGLGIMGGQL